MIAANAGDADPAEELPAADLPEPAADGAVAMGRRRARGRPERRGRLGADFSLLAGQSPFIGAA